VRRRGVGEETEDRERRYRLARARLANECDRLGVADVERHMLDRMRERVA